MIIKGIKKAEFKKQLVNASGGCNIQHNGWPCGTCFSYAFDDDDDDALAQLYWWAVLAYRGDYEENRFVDEKRTVTYKMCSGFEQHPDGTFKRHIFEHIPQSKLKAAIQAIWEKLKP